MTRIQLRRDTASNFSTANPVLAEGEAGFETNTNKLKIGNGEDNYNDLDYIAGDKVTGDGVTDIVALTQAQYNALATKDPNTLYTITDASTIDDELYYKAGDTFTPSSTIYVAGDSYNNKTSFLATLTLPKRLTNISTISWVVDATYVYQESSRYLISSSDTNLRIELFKASDIHLNIRITTIDGTEMLPSGRANVILGFKGTLTFS